VIHVHFAIDGCFAGITTRNLVIVSFCFLTDFAALGIFAARVNRLVEPYYALHTTSLAVSLWVRVYCVRCCSFLKDCLTECQSITLAPTNVFVVSDLCTLPLPLLCCAPCLYVHAADCLCVFFYFMFCSLFFPFLVLLCFPSSLYILLLSFSPCSLLFILFFQGAWLRS